MLTVGPRIWRETMKIVENEKCIQQELEFGEKRENEQNETETLHDLAYGKKQRKTWKMREAQYKTWNIARNIEKRGK